MTKTLSLEKYSITISHNKEPNVPPVAIYCKQWDIRLDEYSVASALEAMFGTIKVLEEETNFKKKKFDWEDIRFDIPAVA